MIAVIVANPTPADNEGGKILRLEKYCYEKHYKFIASMFFILFTGVASARDQRQRKLFYLVQTS